MKRPPPTTTTVPVTYPAEKHKDVTSAAAEFEEIVSGFLDDQTNTAAEGGDGTEGLIGLFGHGYITDPDDADAVMIQYQFKILRKMDSNRYVVQYFSFMDGSPTRVGVYSEAELLGDTIKLYATTASWNDAYEKDCEKLDMRRRSRALT